MHRQALDVTARAFRTDEGLLRAVLPDRDAPALFSWLSGLPFVETVGNGVHPHGAVRAALLADLERRGDTHDATLSALTHELLRRVRDAAEPAALSAMADRSVDTGEPVGFAARLVLHARHREDVDADPVVAAAWRYCKHREPVREGQHIAVRRFTIAGEGQAFPSAMTNLVSWQSLTAIARSSGLAHAFVVHPDPELWRTWMGATTDEIEEPPTAGRSRSS